MSFTAYQIGLLENALGSLVGEPMTSMFRVSTAQYLCFGVENPSENHIGEDDNRSDWGLMIGGSCHWRFEGPDGFTLGTDDFGPDKELRDEHADDFYDRLENNPLIVRSIEILQDGVQVISLSDGYSLTTRMPDSVSKDSEPWRFMPQLHDFRGHLCLTEFGLRWGFRLVRMRKTNAIARCSRRKEIKYYPGTRLKKRYNRAEQAKCRLKYG